jgi:hypothetical protein
MQILTRNTNPPPRPHKKILPTLDKENSLDRWIVSGSSVLLLVVLSAEDMEEEVVVVVSSMLYLRLWDTRKLFRRLTVLETKRKKNEGT